MSSITYVMSVEISDHIQLYLELGPINGNV